jgi:hypothetical protein
MLRVSSLLCVLRRHQPSMPSLARGKQGGCTALCDACGVPIERGDKGSWRASEPAMQRR